MEVFTVEGAKPTESWEELPAHARGLRQDLAEVAAGQCAQRVAWRGCREGDEGEKCRDLAPCFTTVWIDLRCRGNHWPPSSRETQERIHVSHHHPGWQVTTYIHECQVSRLGSCLISPTLEMRLMWTRLFFSGCPASDIPSSNWGASHLPRLGGEAGCSSAVPTGEAENTKTPFPSSID